MTRLGILWVIAAFAVLLGGSGYADEPAKELPEFKEVYDLVHEHAGGISEEELNRAAVKGLLSALNPKVVLVTNDGAAGSRGVSLIVRSNLYDGEIAFVRIGRVGDGLGQAFRAAFDGVKGTNKLKGVVLDLRYASGDDYAAAAAVVDLFLSKEQAILNWGGGVTRSKSKQDAITAPVAVLINRETRGAAEALAAAVRQTGAGLILGSRTAGEAMVAKEYPLKNGQRLRVATARIEVGDNTTLSPEGVKPDIEVDVGAADERIYYADAYRVITRPEVAANSTLSSTNQGVGTNRPARRRFNEAELVRERKEGVSFDAEASDKGDEPDRPSVHDPALARALDLLKGLAVVRHSS